MLQQGCFPLAPPPPPTRMSPLPPRPPRIVAASSRAETKNLICCASSPTLTQLRVWRAISPKNGGLSVNPGENWSDRHGVPRGVQTCLSQASSILWGSGWWGKVALEQLSRGLVSSDAKWGPLVPPDGRASHGLVSPCRRDFCVPPAASAQQTDPRWANCEHVCVEVLEHMVIAMSFD